jgi:cytochrome P450
MSVSYDPFSAEWRDDPYPKYRELREHAPVHYAAASNLWCVSRFDDVAAVLKSPERFSSRAMFTQLMNAGQGASPPLSFRLLRFLVRLGLSTRTNPLGFATTRTLIAEDGDSHSALRSIVNRGFSPRQIASWEKRAREIVDAQIAKLDRGERFDVVRDLAIPLPVTIIAEMLGVDAARLPDFKRWSDSLIENSTGSGRAEPLNARFLDTLLEMISYITHLARERRRRPQADLISTIVASQGGEATLTDREVAQFVVLLLVAGNETTTNLIGNAANALLDHPAELARVAADAALIPGLIEETLRFDPPIQFVLRTATQDLEIAGVRVPRGATVAPLIGSAHRDQRRFPEPDRFDVTRTSQGHLGFGFGAHFCLGASLARLEARTALEALVPRLVGRARVQQNVARVDSFLVRGPKAMELTKAA